MILTQQIFLTLKRPRNHKNQSPNSNYNLKSTREMIEKSTPLPMLAKKDISVYRSISREEKKPQLRRDSGGDDGHGDVRWSGVGLVAAQRLRGGDEKSRWRRRKTPAKGMYNAGA
jgi:hypothetical protein